MYNRTASTVVNLWVTLYYSNKAVMHCNKVSIQKLLDCFDNDLENNIEKNAGDLSIMQKNYKNFSE